MRTQSNIYKYRFYISWNFLLFLLIIYNFGATIPKKIKKICCTVNTVSKNIISIKKRNFCQKPKCRDKSGLFIRGAKNRVEFSGGKIRWELTGGEDILSVNVSCWIAIGWIVTILISLEIVTHDEIILRVNLISSHRHRGNREKYKIPP